MSATSWRSAKAAERRSANDAIPALSADELLSARIVATAQSGSHRRTCPPRLCDRARRRAVSHRAGVTKHARPGPRPPPTPVGIGGDRYHPLQLRGWPDHSRFWAPTAKIRVREHSARYAQSLWTGVAGLHHYLEPRNAVGELRCTEGLVDDPCSRPGR